MQVVNPSISYEHDNCVSGLLYYVDSNLLTFYGNVRASAEIMIGMNFYF